jgi:hypothetical protein
MHEGKPLWKGMAPVGRDDLAEEFSSLAGMLHHGSGPGDPAFDGIVARLKQDPAVNGKMLDTILAFHDPTEKRYTERVAEVAREKKGWTEAAELREDERAFKQRLETGLNEDEKVGLSLNARKGGFRKREPLPDLGRHPPTVQRQGLWNINNPLVVEKGAEKTRLDLPSVNPIKRRDVWKKAGELFPDDSVKEIITNPGKRKALAEALFPKAKGKVPDIGLTVLNEILDEDVKNINRAATSVGGSLRARGEGMTGKDLDQVKWRMVG